MTEIYTAPALAQLKKKLLICRILVPVFLLSGLLTCILLCTGVNTRNADGRQLAVVLTAVLSGWAAICILILLLKPLKARTAHFEGILSDASAVRTGILLSVSGKLYIPNSITIRKVTLLTGGEEQVLNILADQARLLPAPGTQLTVRTVRSYIAGIGGCHE